MHSWYQQRLRFIPSEVEADPILKIARGRYTNFVNFADLSALPNVIRETVCLQVLP
jgi:hypothetical protein